MRLLVTGAAGQLGAELVTRARREGVDVTGLDRKACDITDPAAVDRQLGLHVPDALVNCAAWNDVDGAEKLRGEAFSANEEGPRVLASACSRRGVLLVHMSTDYVFDGQGAVPLDESAAPHPLSAYGESKLAGEQAVCTTTQLHQVVRTSALYGQAGPNFVLSILRAARAGKPLRVVADQTTSPTWTGDLAPALLRLTRHRIAGTYHLTNSGSTTWHGLAVAALRRAGYTLDVAPITTAEYGAAARRPAMSVLDNGAWRALGEAPLPTWESALDRYITQLERERPLLLS